MSKIAWSKPIEWVFDDGSIEKAEFVGKSETGSFRVKTEYGPLYCDEYGAYSVYASGYIRNVQDHSEPENATLRDQFAMAALQGLCAQSQIHAMSHRSEDTASKAYRLADAMLAARDK